MESKTVRVGILSREAYKARSLAIASGKYVPRNDEPKIWFESLKSMAQVLGSENRRLLRMILEYRPESLGALEKLSGRNKSNLSRTLKTLERYGIVRLRRNRNRLVPEVLATDFRVEFGIEDTAA